MKDESTTNATVESSAAPRRSLTFEQAVPSSLAHRRSLAEVYVADTILAGADEYCAAIQIPRAHSVWFDRLVAYHDTLSTVEAIRQALAVIRHRYLGIPNDTPFSLQWMKFCVEDLSVYRDNERSPLEGIVRIRLENEIAYYKDLSFEATMTIDTVQALTVCGGGIAFDRETYDELRQQQQRRRRISSITANNPSAPLEPSLVGRRDARNVVVGRLYDNSNAAADQLTLIADQRHPYFFDHSYDHVPAPLFLEAIRQAAIVAATSSSVLPSPIAAVTSACVEFKSFAELNESVTCSTKVRSEGELSDIGVAVRLNQCGEEIANAEVELTPYP
jgi:hypothetical protein